MGLGGSRSVRICSHFCKCKGAPEFKSRTPVNDYDYEYMEGKKAAQYHCQGNSETEMNQST